MELDADDVDYDGDSWESSSGSESDSSKPSGHRRGSSRGSTVTRPRNGVYVSSDGSVFGCFGDSGSEGDSGDERCGAQFWGPPPPPRDATARPPVDAGALYAAACDAHEGMLGHHEDAPEPVPEPVPVPDPVPEPEPEPWTCVPSDRDTGFASESDTLGDEYDDKDNNCEDQEERHPEEQQPEQQQQQQQQPQRRDDDGWGDAESAEWPAVVDRSGCAAGATRFVLGARPFRPRAAPCASAELPLLADCVPGVRAAAERGTPLRRVDLCRGVALVPARLDPGTAPDFLPGAWRAGAVLAAAFEGTQIEFKRGQHWTVQRIADDVARYGNAFVNTRGGVLAYGVTDRGVVEGVPLTRAERDAFHNRASTLLAGFRPAVPPECFRLSFHPVLPPEAAAPKAGSEVAAPSDGASAAGEAATAGSGEKEQPVGTVRGQVTGTFLQTRTVAKGSECQSERYVVLFAMLYHKTGESRYIAMTGSSCFAVQRVGSVTGFVRLQLISLNRETAAAARRRAASAEVEDNDETTAEAEEAEAEEDRRAMADLLRRQERALAARQTLPAYRERARIAAAIAGHRVTVVTGAPGSGKSTQIAQIVLEADETDAAAGAGGGAAVPVRVVVAQPRRLAAMRLAQRVATEMGVAVGTEVGYHVGRRRHCDDTTRVLFVTYGILQLYFARGHGVAGFTHIVVDEVHERLVETDVCLALAAMHLRAHPETRLVVMSATVDAHALAQYFARELPAPTTPLEPRSPGPVLPPVAVVALDAPQHPVTVAYLDDLVRGPVLAGLREQFVPARPRLTEAARAAILAIVERLCSGAPPSGASASAGGGASTGASASAASSTGAPGVPTGSGAAAASVLVFLPGIATVLSVYDMLALSAVAPRLALCMLHSSCAEREQRRAMAPPPAGRVKVVLCTNIIESSVTVPDAAVVVDTLLARQTRYDAATRQQVLETVWVSRDSAAQRAGRCGRVAAGTVFRLAPRDFYERVLPAHNTPEIRRVTLSDCILRTIGARDGAPEHVLAHCIDPPPPAHVRAALQGIVDLGLARTRTPPPQPGSSPSKGRGNSNSNRAMTRLTSAGYVIAQLPVSWELGLFLVYCHCYGVLAEGVVLAALVAREQPFLRFVDNPRDAQTAVLAFSGGLRCDLVASANAYYWWHAERSRLNFGGPAYTAMLARPTADGQAGAGADGQATADPQYVAEFSWCESYGLHLPTLREIDDLVYQLRERLAFCGMCKAPRKSETAMRAMYQREQAVVDNQFDYNSDDDDDEFEEDEQAGFPENEGEDDEESYSRVDADTQDPQMGAAAIPTDREEMKRLFALPGGMDARQVMRATPAMEDPDVSIEDSSDEEQEQEDGEEEDDDLAGEKKMGESAGTGESTWGTKAFWKNLYYSQESRESIVFLLQCLLAGACPNNIVKFVRGSKRKAEWDAFPEGWELGDTALVRCLNTAELDEFTSTLAQKGIRCTTSPAPGDGVQQYVRFSEAPEDIAEGESTPFSSGTDLTPPMALAEPLVLVKKWRRRGVLSRPPGSGLGAVPDATAAECVLPRCALTLSPRLLLTPLFAYRKSSGRVMTNRLSLSYPATAPCDDGDALDDAEVGAADLSARERARVARRLCGGGLEAAAAQQQQQQPALLGVATGLLVVSEQSDSTVRRTFARRMSLFVRQVPSLVLSIPLVFLRNVQYEHGMMDAAFCGCSIRQYVSVPRRDLHAIAQQRRWLNTCLKRLAKHLALPPNTSQEGDSDESAAAMRDALLRFLTGNGIVPSAVPRDGLGANTADFEPHPQLLHNRYRRRRNQH